MQSIRVYNAPSLISPHAAQSGTGYRAEWQSLYGRVEQSGRVYIAQAQSGRVYRADWQSLYSRAAESILQSL